MSRCANENLSPRSFLSQFSLSVARQTHLFLFFDVHEDAVMNLESFGRTKQKPTARDDRVLCLHVDHGAMHDEWVGLFGTGRLYRHLKRVTVREREVSVWDGQDDSLSRHALRILAMRSRLRDHIRPCWHRFAVLISDDAQSKLIRCDGAYLC